MQDPLQNKYGADTLQTGIKIQGQAFVARLAQRDALDQHFTQSWLDYQIRGLSSRPALDTRTRLLVLIGQYTMAKSQPLLDETIRAALTAKVALREITEIILQCMVYGGHTTVDPAIRTFYAIAQELHLLSELQATQLPLEGNNHQRDRESEEKRWNAQDRDDPRTAKLIEKHGWHGVSQGLLMRPGHHINLLSWLDTIDSEFAGLWVKFCYANMYTRSILDDKTRLLCMVGDCLAIGEATQALAHMRGAMRQGATPREVMEVIFQTSANFGMPPALKALEGFVLLMNEEGRLSEIGNPPLKVESYAK